MKIKKLNITAFGGIKNKEIEFNDGFNVIYGDNENGKTTVMSFIKMMFYGSGRGSNQIAKNIRKKYTPWDGGIMAGSIDFEQNNKNYRLEREFRNSDSTDKITLYDLDFGTSESVSNEIGFKLLGLTSAAFERSVFIGQLGVMENDSAAEGELNSRLSNIATSGDESVSFNTVNARLEKAKTLLMSKSGRAGEYDKAVKKIEELKKSLEESEKIHSDYSSFKDRVKSFKEDMAKDVHRVTVLKAKLQTEQDVRNAEKLREMLRLKGELDNLNNELKLNDGGFADEMFVKKLDFCFNKIESAERELENKKAEANRLKESIELAAKQGSEVTPEKAEELRKAVELKQNELNELENRLNNSKAEQELLLVKENAIKNSKKTLNIPLLATGIGFIAIALFAFIYNIIIIAGASAFLGLTAFILSFVLRPKDKKKIEEFYSNLTLLKTEQTDLQLKISGAGAELSGITARYEAINAALNTSSAMLEHQKESLNSCNNEILETEKQKGEEEKLLFDLFARYKEPVSLEQIKTAREQIFDLAGKQKEIKNELNYIAKDIGNISYDEVQSKLDSLPDTNEHSMDFDALKEEYEALLADLSQKKQELAVAENTALSKLSAAENPETLNKQIAELIEKTNSQKDYCDSLDIALDVLAESFGELRRSYGSALEKKAGEIFSGLTGGKYEGMQISKAFDINVEKSGVFGGKELAFLSSGTVDQAYLSLRLALSTLIFEDAERLPILLDDALTQYDDTRVSKAIEYLTEFSENGQTVMFTCHSSIYKEAEKIGAECKTI